MRKFIKNEVRDDERAYYGSRNISFDNIVIEGPIDGESAFKECMDIEVSNSKFALRYPFWHVTNGLIKDSIFDETARAAFWYDNNLTLRNINSKGVKALRECKKVEMTNCSFTSIEFGWKCIDLIVKDSYIEGYYPFFSSENVKITNLKLLGKYSFQYVKEMEIYYSNLDTKDAFWHSKNVTVRDTVINGEYLGWYSENLTLVNCKITGTQPLCYCKNLVLIDCTTEDCDLAFENSQVNGNIIGDIISIKNPLSGKLHVSGKCDLIQDQFDLSNGRFQLD